MVSNFDDLDFIGFPVVITASVCLHVLFFSAFTRILARILVRKWTFIDCKHTLSYPVKLQLIRTRSFLRVIGERKSLAMHVHVLNAEQILAIGFVTFTICC